MDLASVAVPDKVAIRLDRVRLEVYSEDNITMQ
jgi:hypothetical protein